MKTTSFLGIIVSFLLLTHPSLIFARKNINHAETATSRNFSLKTKNKVAILPFVNEGKEGTDNAVADKLSLKLMSMGFTVVERTQLERIFSEHKLNFTGALSSKELKEIGKVLSIDMIVFGINNYKYTPGRDSHRKKLVSQSVRFVDVETGEVMISSYCCDVKVPKQQIGYIVDSIRKKIKKR